MMMSKSKKDPRFDIDQLELTPFEQQIEKDFEAGLYTQVENHEEMKEKFVDAAKNYRKSKMISIRIQGDDLLQIKAKAKELGIPYQKLINMLIHFFNQDKIELPKN